MTNKNDLLEELLEADFTYTVSKAGVYLDGFYKSSGVTLVFDDVKQEWVATARYNEKTVVESLDDLVHLNYQWWQYSKDRYDGWVAPEEKWLPLMVKLGLVTVKTETKTVTTYR